MTLLKGFKIRTPYLLLLPGMAFLLTFFIFPLINLAQTSTQTPVGGGDTGQYEQTFRFGNYIDAFVEYQDQDTGDIIKNKENSRAIFDGRMK